jgi:transcriptional regulator with GAF, ATPase, and Fis domain
MPDAFPLDGPQAGLDSFSPRAVVAEKLKMLLRLQEINRRLASELDLTRLLAYIMDTAIEVTQAERGCLLLRTGDKLQYRAVRNIRGPADEVFRLSRSIVATVIRSGSPVMTFDACTDRTFGRASSVQNLKLRSVLAVPLSIRDETIGALYLDNRLTRGVFAESDRQMIESFADQAALAIENARLYEENVRSRRRIEALNAQLQAKVEHQEGELRRMHKELESNRRELGVKYAYDNIVGGSPAMQALFRTLDRVTEADLPVLIQGESGTGKELIAKAIHHNGPRRERPFASENCAAIPDSLLEAELFGHVKGAFTGAEKAKAGILQTADGGTLFLDEVGDMSLKMQKNLLRVLQEGELRRVGGRETARVNVRLICATNRDLAELVAKGEFREDLFYRINVITIRVPPLRERREDIPLLVEHFVERAAGEGAAPKTVTPGAMQALAARRWPGNIRQLENAVKCAASLADGSVLDVSAFEGRMVEQVVEETAAPVLLPDLSLDEYMRQFVVQNQNRMTDTEMARVLGVSRKTLWERRKRWELPRPSPAR